MTRRRLRDDDRGVSALELAVIAPSLIALIFFGIQVALYFYARSVALQAAREGVAQLRLAQTQSQYDSLQSPTAASVARFAQGVGNGALEAPKATSDYNDAQGRVTVVVTGKSISLVPFLDLHVTQRASGQVERFQDADG